MFFKVDLFSVNPKNGEIFLEKPLKKPNLKNHQLKVECSNGIQKTVCQANLEMISTPNEYSRPVWIKPNPVNFNQCICIIEVFYLF